MPTSVSSIVTRFVVPVLLFVLTAAYCWGAGGPAFAATVLIIAGAHGFGHFVVARRCGVACLGPYFAPYQALFGTCGAFLRLQWPIVSRLSLARIFLAGPILGIAFSIGAMAIGLSSSEIITSTDDGHITFEFGDSLLSFGLEWLLFGDLTDQQVVLLSPIGWAGWVGLHLNMIQLLPVGRFDGGRLVTALFGFRKAQGLSFAFIGLMLASYAIAGGFPYIALFAAGTHVGLKEQYEGLDMESLGSKQAWATGIVLVILLVLVFPFRSPDFGIP